MREKSQRKYEKIKKGTRMKQQYLTSSKNSQRSVDSTIGVQKTSVVLLKSTKTQQYRENPLKSQEGQNGSTKSSYRHHVLRLPTTSYSNRNDSLVSRWKRDSSVESNKPWDTANSINSQVGQLKKENKELEARNAYLTKFAGLLTKAVLQKSSLIKDLSAKLDLKEKELEE